MKTRILASSALAALVFSSPANALDIRLGGNVAFKASEGDYISAVVTTASGMNAAYTDDVVADADLTFTTSADLNVTADYRTRTLDYGAYINLDLDESSAGSLALSDVDSHIRVRFSEGTFKFGTDIDGLQNAEDLDWITKGPIGLSNSISSAIASHAFQHSVTEASTNDADMTDYATAVGDSSITFTSNKMNGLTLAAEVTPSGNDLDWGASLKYEGRPFMGGDMVAVVATDSSEAVLGNLQLGFGDITLNLFGGADADDEKYEGGAIAYDMGALAISGAYITKSAETLNGGLSGATAKQQDLLLGAAYTLAPGLTVDGSYIKEDRTDNNAMPAQDLEADRYEGRIKLTF